jgi:hypothetical protein
MKVQWPSRPNEYPNLGVWNVIQFTKCGPREDTVPSCFWAQADIALVSARPLPEGARELLLCVVWALGDGKCEVAIELQ